MCSDEAHLSLGLSTPPPPIQVLETMQQEKVGVLANRSEGENYYIGQTYRNSQNPVALLANEGIAFDFAGDWEMR